MQIKRRYPNLSIRSKNELAKHISHKKFSYSQALELINDVKNNFDSYWKDNLKHSEPEKDKWVRNAKGSPLGKLLDKINKIVLAPHDNLLPNFIFGGVKGMNHKKASEFLLGKKRKRVMLKMDITRFFEQISDKRVFYFFYKKCGCSVKASKLMAELCCVSLGKKNSGSANKSIGRGFATSSRLAVWCNLDTFINLNNLVQKELKGQDPRVGIYVDDIGITASRVSKEKMEKISKQIEELLKSDKNQLLPLNTKKTKIISHEEGIEHLGLRFYRNKLSIGSKTKSKIDKAKLKIKKGLSTQDRKKAKAKHKSLNYYRIYVENNERENQKNS